MFAGAIVQECMYMKRLGKVKVIIYSDTHA